MTWKHMRTLSKKVPYPVLQWLKRHGFFASWFKKRKEKDKKDRIKEQRTGIFFSSGSFRQSQLSWYKNY